MITPEQFGAVGDGKADDAGAIQAAIDASMATGEPLRFAAKVYGVASELRLTAPFDVAGVGPIGANPGSTLLALAPMRSVLHLGAEGTIDRLRIDARFLADHALWLAGCSNAALSRLRVVYARRDGVLLSAYKDDEAPSINDLSTWTDCVFANSGRMWGSDALRLENVGRYLSPQQWIGLGAVKANALAGENVVRLDGLDLTTLGLRAGDTFRCGSESARRYRMITGVVDATTLLLAEPWESDVVDAPFTIASGDGYHEERHGDNNANRFYGCGARGNAGVGFAFDGLYGPQVIGGYVDFAPSWAIRVGTLGSGSVLGSTFIATYLEAVGSGKPWLFRAAQGAVVLNPMDWEYQLDPIDYQGNKSYVFGRYYNNRGRKPIGYYYGTGGAQ